MKEEYELNIDRFSRVKVRKNGPRFSFVYLIYTDRWTDIARIDNYPHEGREGVHIHRLHDERVEFRDMDFEEALETIRRIGKSIKERMRYDPYRGC